MAKKDFTWESGEEITKLILEKVVDCVETLDSGQINDYLTIKFKDGTALHMRYDWIYDWEVKHG